MEESAGVGERTSQTPTMGETSQALYNGIFSQPYIAALTTIPTLNSSNSCPIFTIPSSKFWSPLPIDLHCTVLEQNRNILSGLFIGIWTLTAAFVFLRA